MKIEISAENRTLQGTGASRRLRRSGKVPAIIYGGDQTAQPIEMDHNDLFHKLKLEAFHASILTMNIGGKKEQVLLRDIQMHPYKQLVLHVDFQRVAKDKKIHMKVPLHFVNAEVSPGVKTAGGIVSHILNEVDVSCLPGDLPEYIQVDLADMVAGHTLHLSDLVLPKGVEIVSLMRGDNAAVATIVIPRSALTDEGAGEAAAEKK